MRSIVEETPRIDGVDANEKGNFADADE